MAQTMSMPPKGSSKKPDRPGRYPRPLSPQTLAAKLGPQRLYTRSRGDAAATTVLIAPAGAGKSHTMAGFARLWTAFTVRRVIGLTTSTNAAPPGLAAATTDAVVSRLVVLVQAAVSSAS